MEQNGGQRIADGVCDGYSGILGTYDGIPLEHYKPSGGDVIVARYDPERLPRDKVYELHGILHEAFRGNNVVTLPHDISLKQMKVIFVVTQSTESGIELHTWGAKSRRIHGKNIDEACMKLLGYLPKIDIAYVDIRGFGINTADILSKFINVVEMK